MDSQKKCFIITPIGEKGSKIREEFEGIINSVLKPVLIENKFKPFVAHEIGNPGMISFQIMDHIIKDDLAIVNLTGLNPNVMYELAVRHAFSKHVIIICERSTTLPFDIKDYRTIFYTNTPDGYNCLKNSIQSTLSTIDTEKEDKHNIIYLSRLLNTPHDLTKKEQSTLVKTLINNLNDIQKMYQDSTCDLNWTNMKYFMALSGKSLEEIENTIKYLRTIKKINKKIH